MITAEDVGNYLMDYKKHKRDTSVKKEFKPWLYFNEINQVRLSKQKKVYLKWKYGLTESDFINMWNKQNGKCAICKSAFDVKKVSCHVDHNHSTEKIRGLLCRECNVMLGLCKDNPDILRSAFKYLIR